ncbi:MAG: hypothetical protein WKF59_11785 [Chitinophagaceae bacterium]
MKSSDAKISHYSNCFYRGCCVGNRLIGKSPKTYPQAQIDFLLRKGNEGLLLNHPFLNAVLIWDKKQNKWGNLINILKQIRKNSLR